MNLIKNQRMKIGQIKTNKKTKFRDALQKRGNDFYNLSIEKIVTRKIISVYIFIHTCIHIYIYTHTHRGTHARTLIYT